MPQKTVNILIKDVPIAQIRPILEAAAREGVIASPKGSVSAAARWAIVQFGASLTEEESATSE